MDDRTIAEFHRDRVRGSGCPGDEDGKHYFAFQPPSYEIRTCIDCGEPEPSDARIGGDE